MQRMMGWGTLLVLSAALACGDVCLKSEQPLQADDAEGFVLQFEGTATPADALSAFAFDVDEEGAVGAQTLYKDVCKERDTIGVTAPLTTLDGRGVWGAGELSFPSVYQPGSLSVTTWLPAAADETWLRSEAEAAVGTLGPLDAVDLVFTRSAPTRCPRSRPSTTSRRTESPPRVYRNASSRSSPSSGSS